MAAESSHTLVHYRSTKVNSLQTNLETTPPQGGKPNGFWYAYGTDWKNMVEAKQLSHLSSKKISLRYEVTLPDNVFVKNVGSITPNTILILSASNLDAFMKRFHKPAYKFSPASILESAFYRLIESGDSSILHEVAKKDESGRFRDYLIEIQEEIEATEDPEDILDYSELAAESFPELFENLHPSKNALHRDNLHDYDWVAFWENVATSIGGVEFDTDLFSIEEWNGIFLPWTSELDIYSGVIFHPSTFRDGEVIKQLVESGPVSEKRGGRRRTYRSQKGKSRRRRNQTRHRRRRV